MRKSQGVVYPVFIICLLAVLIFIPLNSDDEFLSGTTIYVQPNKRYDLYEKTLVTGGGAAQSPTVSPGDIAVEDIRFSPDMDPVVAEINRILYTYAVRYTAAGREKYPDGPAVTALCIISSATTEKHPRPADLFMWLKNNF
jgi:hypothetical protein